MVYQWFRGRCGFAEGYCPNTHERGDSNPHGFTRQILSLPTATDSKETQPSHIGRSRHNPVRSATPRATEIYNSAFYIETNSQEELTVTVRTTDGPVFLEEERAL